MAEVKRKHHYIPRFYLAGFTPTGADKEFLHVFDLEKRERRRARPETVAYVRDFYRVDAPETDPNVAEDAFATVEGRVSRIISKLLTVPVVPVENDEYETLMYFVALLCVRTPGVRAEQMRFMEEVGKHIMQMSVQTPQRWASAVKQTHVEDTASPSNADYQKMKTFIDKDDYRLRVGRNWLVANVVELAGEITPWLLKRKWWLLKAEEGAEDFVTSDNPVVVSWSKPTSIQQSPGFGLKNTIVTVPLHRRLALVGQFGGTSALLPANAETVASINFTTAVHAQRYVFAPHEEFAVQKKDRSIGSGSDLLFSRLAVALQTKKDARDGKDKENR